MTTLQELIESEICDFFAGFGSPGEPETPEEMQSQLLSRVMPLLAGMGKEPVGYYREATDGDGYYLASTKGPRPGTIPLYAAPQLPQPAVAEPVTWISRNKKTGEVGLAEPHEVATNPEYWTDALPVYGTPMSAQLPPEMSPEMMRAVQLNSELGAYATANLSDAYDLFAEFWQVACRAAMLQGADPVSQRDELPLDYLQGHKDGLEWAARLAEANHPQTGDWLYDDPLELAKAIRKGPDMPAATVQGWIPCSERMPLSPEEGCEYWDVEVQAFDGERVLIAHYAIGSKPKPWGAWVDTHAEITHWQPLAEAPQQEAE